MIRKYKHVIYNHNIALEIHIDYRKHMANVATVLVARKDVELNNCLCKSMK